MKKHNTDYKVDAVITWVDGEDPTHIAKRKKYGASEIFQAEDIAGATRYNSLGEICYCVASINRFLPWINKIYIVTDNQQPDLFPFLEKHFPQGFIDIEVIDHKVIFDGFSEYLPTFNSISIESMTWRIPNLSEHYIEFNDDLMINRPLEKSDFFTDEGIPVCYAVKINASVVNFTRKVKKLFSSREKVSYKQTMLNAISRMESPSNNILKVHHTPKALIKSFFEEYFSKHEDVLRENISHRFRNPLQFNPQQLLYLTLYQQGKCTIKDYSKELLYIQCRPDDKYVNSKLEYFKSHSDAKFVCINSLDKSTEYSKEQIVAWLENLMELK